RIHVFGPVHRVAIVGAILAKRWAREGRELVLSPSPEEGQETSLITRPDQRVVHAELGLSLDDLAQHAGATPIFAVHTNSPDGRVYLPYSQFGMPRSGIEFHQFWQRANTHQKQPDLNEFSLALAMSNASDQVRFAALGKLPLQFGLKLDRGRYSHLLLGNAQANGAQIVQDVTETLTDLSIDCRISQNVPGWEGRVLQIAGDRDIPGLEWQVCVNAARRFVALSPNLNDSENEQREFTRLAVGEQDRIADMRALLNGARPGNTNRPDLKRKIDVFTACGRIPTEDFEVFSQPEWLAALWARGIRPKRYDRMAKAMPENALLAWLASMHGEIAKIAQQGQAA
ncbi:MAG: tryptophan 7-halogenase, partial [Pseudomonadota bacterium]